MKTNSIIIPLRPVGGGRIGPCEGAAANTCLGLGSSELRNRAKCTEYSVRSTEMQLARTTTTSTYAAICD